MLISQHLKVVNNKALLRTTLASEMKSCKFIFLKILKIKDIKNILLKILLNKNIYGGGKISFALRHLIAAQTLGISYMITPPNIPLYSEITNAK